MEISKEDVIHVAELARVQLTDSEATKLQQDLSQIFGHFKSLNEVDTSTVNPTIHASGAQIVLARRDIEKSHQNLRQDEIRRPLSPNQVLLNAPRTEDGFIRIKGVLD
jgi:aspartyl-tRNA(Asn)/glutamyl-tRNA(Gln) amidotransferase subunit C